MNNKRTAYEELVPHSSWGSSSTYPFSVCITSKPHSESQIPLSPFEARFLRAAPIAISLLLCSCTTPTRFSCLLPHSRLLSSRLVAFRLVSSSPLFSLLCSSPAPLSRAPSRTRFVFWTFNQIFVRSPPACLLPSTSSHLPAAALDRLARDMPAPMPLPPLPPPFALIDLLPPPPTRLLSDDSD